MGVIHHTVRKLIDAVKKDFNLNLNHIEPKRRI